MLPTAKIINDPVHGFIRIPEGRVLRALSSPIVQRLRRLSQLGLAYFVYPGAVHTRFAHALGVMHLADEALTILTRKGVQISADTWESVLLGALLHDIGHGPFSHSLEGLIVPLSHEQLGEEVLALLEKEVGELAEVRALWRGSHEFPFLSELLISQLDVDRLDYLVRDSFFTGVQEGLIGTERLIHTMAVADNRLVIEEKGLNSVEKFIVTRRFMYWQVYLHKGVLGAERLLQRWWAVLDAFDCLPEAVRRLRSGLSDTVLDIFLRLDESIVWSWIHEGVDSIHPPVRALSRALLWRIPYKVRFLGEPSQATEMYQEWIEKLPPQAHPWKEWFWIEGWAENLAYLPAQGEDIYIFQKDNRLIPLAEASPWLRALGAPMRRFFVGAIPAALLESLLR
ncbi:MAG: HD domain-containing protein [Bacteroidia bacterium]|nr:HD domain-containing protein [Bacteroidia bacterium]